MTLFKMIKEAITYKEVSARCACGQEYEYPKDSPYKPKTCGSFICEYRYQHPEINTKEDRE